MKQTLGIILLLVGMFVLGIGVRRMLASQSYIISPIPDSDTVRVIKITPTPN